MQHGTFHSRPSLGAAIHRIARRGMVAVVGAGLVASTGCYTYTAVPATQPLAEQSAEFRINDAGRVQLAPQMGPGVTTVEGRVVRQNADGWTVRVYRITNIRDESTTWTGEVVEIPASAVELVQRRDFDRQRSFVAAAAVAGSVTVFVLSRSLLGGGSSPDPGGGGGNPGQSIRF